MMTALAILGILIAIPVALYAVAEFRYFAGWRAVDRAWRQQRPEKLKNVGATRSLAILPLIDWFPGSPGATRRSRRLLSDQDRSKHDPDGCRPQPRPIGAVAAAA